MLIYETIGPTTTGNYLVAYQTPGCTVSTVVRICRTAEQAICEAERLNAEQAAREATIQREHELCGLFRIQSGVEAIHGR